MRATDLALKLRALVSADNCLLLDSGDASDSPIVIGTGPEAAAGLSRGTWEAVLGTAKPTRRYGLVVCDARDEGSEACGWERRGEWLAIAAARVALVLPGVSSESQPPAAPDVGGFATAESPPGAGVDGSSAALGGDADDLPGLAGSGRSPWEAPLLASGFVQITVPGLGLLPRRIGLYARADLAASPIADAHLRLIKRDMDLGLLARTFTLQYELDMWRAKAQARTNQVERLEEELSGLKSKLASVKAGLGHRGKSRLITPLRKIRRKTASDVKETEGR